MSSETDPNAPFAFVANFSEQRNNFAFYLGGVMMAMFFLILFVSFVRKRELAAVVVLSKPGLQWMVYEYLVVLKTSLKLSAGLTRHGRVSVQLLGNFHNSKWFHLHQEAIPQKILQRGHTDTFVLHTPVDLGELQCVSIKLSTWPSGVKCSWKPCFVEVIRCSTLERWGAKVSNVMTCKTTETWTYDLQRNKREYRSFIKLLMIYHSWLALFNNPHRLGAYTNVTNVIVFFFTNAVLLITTLSAYIFAHMLTGDTMEMYSRSENDVILCSLCSTVVLGFLQVLELFLRNIRPSRVRPHQPAWSGLWQREFPIDPEFVDIEYEWDSPAFFASHMDHRTASVSSLISLESSISSSSSECLVDGTSPPNLPEVSPQKRLRFMLSDAGITKKKIQDHLQIAMDQIAGRKVSETVALPKGFDKYRGKPLPEFEWYGNVDITEVKAIGLEPSHQACFFCLWIKTLPVRGTTLQHYVTRLVRNIRRSFRALTACETPNLTSLVLVMCIHQWLASLCCRMLREAVTHLNQKDNAPKDLTNLLQRLIKEESILWFAELGFTDVRPVASMDVLQKNEQKVKDSCETERLTNLCSNFYIAILRYLAFISHYHDHGIVSRWDQPSVSLSPKGSKQNAVTLADVQISAKDDKKVQPLPSAKKPMFSFFFRKRANSDDSDSTGSDDYNASHVVLRRRTKKWRAKKRGSGPGRNWEHEQVACLGNTVQAGKSLHGSTGDAVDFVKSAPLSWLSGSYRSIQSVKYDFQCSRQVQDSAHHIKYFRESAPALANSERVEQEASPVACSSQLDMFEVDVLQFDDDVLQRTCENGDKIKQDGDRILTNTKNKHFTFFMDQNINDATREDTEAKHALTNSEDSFAGVREEAVQVKLDRIVQFKPDNSNPGREFLPWQQNEHFSSNIDPNGRKGNSGHKRVLVKRMREHDCVGHRDQFSVQGGKIVLRAGKKREQEETMLKQAGTCKVDRISFTDKEQEWPTEDTASSDLEVSLTAYSNERKRLANVSNIENLTSLGSSQPTEMFPRHTTSGRRVSNLEQRDISDNSDSDSLNKFTVGLTEMNRSNSSLYSANRGETIRQGGSSKKYLLRRRHKGPDFRDKNVKRKCFFPQTFSSQSLSTQECLFNRVKSMAGRDISKVRYMKDSRAVGADSNFNRKFHRSKDAKVNPPLNIWHDTRIFRKASESRIPSANLTLVHTLCSNFYNCSNECRFMVESGMGVSCMCCYYPLCQTYAVVFSLLGEYASNILIRLLPKVSKQLVSQQSAYRAYHPTLRPPLSPASLGKRHTAWKAIEKSLQKEIRRKVLAFSKKKRVENNRVKNKSANATDETASTTGEWSSTTTITSMESQQSDRSTWLTDSVDSISLPPEVLDKHVQIIVKKVIEEAKQELFEEVCYLLVMKTFLAKAIGEARLEISRELDDSIQVAICKFSHAKVVSLFRALLPPNYDEDQIVPPNEIRRRRRQRKRRDEKHYDLRAPPKSPWSLEIVEDLVERLTSRWMLNLEYNTHAFTLTFLARSLTLANLHLHGDCQESQLRPQEFRSQRISVFDCMSNVWEVQHKVAQAVDEVASEVLGHIPVMALRVRPAVSEALCDREKLVIYMCETVSILEQRAIGRLSLAVIESGSKAVQDELIRLALEKQQIDTSEQTPEQRPQVRLNTYYSINTREMRSLKLELRYVQAFVKYMLNKMKYFNAKDLKIYLKTTKQIQNQQVRQCVQFMIDSHDLAVDTKDEYTSRQLQEVEWIVAEEVNNTFPSFLMAPLLLFMSLFIVIVVFFTSLLAASLTPDTVGRWFGLHALAMVIWILIMEPIKLIWYMDVGSQDYVVTEMSIDESSDSSFSSEVL